MQLALQRSLQVLDHEVSDMHLMQLTQAPMQGHHAESLFVAASACSPASLKLYGNRLLLQASRSKQRYCCPSFGFWIAVIRETQSTNAHVPVQREGLCWRLCRCWRQTAPSGRVSASAHAPPCGPLSAWRCSLLMQMTSKQSNQYLSLKLQGPGPGTC